MREAAGTTTKSALSHTFLFDTRDDKIAATRGVYAKLFTELAGGPSKNGVGLGLGGNARHIKVEGEGQISRALGTSGVVSISICRSMWYNNLLQALSLSARGGLLWGLGENGATLFSDRFQLGGPTSVRSFKVNGLGPRDGGACTYPCYTQCITPLILLFFELKTTQLAESCIIQRG